MVPHAPTLRLVLPLGVPATTVDQAPAPRTSSGDAIVFLDNTKPSAGVLLRLIDAALPGSATGAERLHLRKAINTGPAAADLLDRAAAKARLFVTGIGD